LKQFGFDAGPVSESTRSVLQKKLAKLRRSSISSDQPSNKDRNTSRSSSRQHRMTMDSTINSGAGDSFVEPLDTTQTSQRSSSLRRNTSNSSLNRSLPKPSPVTTIANNSDSELDVSTQPQNQVYKRNPTPLHQLPVSTSYGFSQTREIPKRAPTPSYQLPVSTSYGFAQTREIPKQASIPPRQLSVSNSYGFAQTRDTSLDRPNFSRQIHSEKANQSLDKPRILPQLERQNLAMRRTTLAATHPSNLLPQRQEANEISNRSEAAKYSSRFAYDQHEPARGKYGTPGGRLSPTRNSPESSSNIPKWLAMIFGSFTLVLALAYFSTAHPETIDRTNRFVLDIAATVFDHAVFPGLFLAIAVGVIFLIYTIYKKYKNADEELKRSTMELVDKIAGRVQFANENGIAEQHLRDTFMPPTRRTEKDMELWNKAVSFINKLDSRMRSERRVISGVECDVWIWATSHDASLG